MIEEPQPETIRLGYAEYSVPDGLITIFGNVDGYPRFTGVIPAPDVNTKTPEIRLKRHAAACDDIILHGYYIISKRLIRNSVFDCPDQKTTMEVSYRVCKNDRECKIVNEQIVNRLAQINKEEECENDR